MGALIYIISALSMLIIFVFLLRFLLPWFGADFRNPIAQGILRATSPVINPLRRIVPSIGRLDTATILVLLIVQAGTVILISALSNTPLTARLVVFSSILGLLEQTLQIFTFAIIIRIVLSWIAPHTHNPATTLLANITDPILRPFQRFIPPIGGFDISPIFAIIALGALGILLRDSLRLFL
ncbi:MAG: YggT family protein [Woeseiaceae bacterium]